MTRVVPRGAAVGLMVVLAWPGVPSAQGTGAGVSPAAAAVTPGTAAVPAVDAPEPPPLAYVVRPGDTPIGIGRELLERPEDWSEIMRVNEIRDARRIRVGRTLVVPALLLKSQPATAVVESVAGEVTIDGRPVTQGQTIAEAASVRTGAGSVVVLRLSDGSTLRLAPASQLRLERLRRYHDDRIVEARILLERGRIETAVAPGRRKPVEVRTPLATAAVRGTTFRVGTGDALASAEVLGGEIRWGESARATPLPGGFGATADPAGVRPPERLLAAPAFANTPATIDTPGATLPFSAVEGAQGYRIQWSNDPTFASLLAEAVVARPEALLDTVRDGPHHLRVRAIAPSRLEGYDGMVTVDVRARPRPPAPVTPRSGATTFDEQARVEWAPSQGAAAYRVELADDPSFRRSLGVQTVDATSATLPLQVAGSSLPRERWWRVAGVDRDSGRAGPWAAPMRIDWRPGLPVPRVRVDDVDQVRIGWTGRADERYRVEIAADPGFGQVARTLDAGQSSTGAIEIGTTGLAVGRWYARLLGGPVAGPEAPPSAPVEFRILRPVSGAAGIVLRSGTGLPVWTAHDAR